ncbi:type I-B CRISPR-associated protein Cas7/Cst2/DevR [Desulforamulus hydrothermalis]|uniref:CRISPR-associated regulatory protein, DevR family n=1 Tax=Desulforamulus hydrothermalis Lam5 = DSM 18033 TaxID=1121428 RepID=K8DYA1_9FIRM|nr:type I-B CRISPR-associated protein Cas7/Cst2/DevR [Desulforamulus hydrothermalis]CCO07754.1 CRISPR-associated regulatory protein, DevR family [Desulforamulus hydrothermalis Lam5 = DSM 18033]SHH46765.1 CRISPR-associated protein Cst2 [Desulforamulus hydrothermalis Lam5 = DSM 18033]
MQAKCLTITYLTKASYASLNGSDKEADNISSIKKIQMADGSEYPYKSSQAIRRDLREQLAVLGETLSEAETAKQTKGAATTQGKPQEFIDDDLFGFMLADKETVKRTSPVRVSPLIALEPYRGELDFATNYMGVKAGGTPNIFESEIHSGFYRGTILIELDRVGVADAPTYKLELENAEKKRRVAVLLDAIQNLWGVGRQSRFLADISPKFICAALLTVKNPIFLECLKVNRDGLVEFSLIESTIKDFSAVIKDSVLGERKGFFAQDTVQALPMGEAFAKMKSWLDDVYK